MTDDRFDEMGESPSTVAAAWRFIGPLLMVGLIAVVVGVLSLVRYLRTWR